MAQYFTGGSLITPVSMPFSQWSYQRSTWAQYSSESGRISTTGASTGELQRLALLFLGIVVVGLE